MICEEADGAAEGGAGPEEPVEYEPRIEGPPPRAGGPPRPLEPREEPVGAILGGIRAKDAAAASTRGNEVGAGKEGGKKTKDDEGVVLVYMLLLC